MESETDFEENVRRTLANPQNQGEMADADTVGTVGSPDCGDMLRMWLKFTEKDGQKVIDRASFQSFGCQTAIAVASMATEMLKGKTVEEAANIDSNELSAPLGDIPPMKIHCGQMVEGALKQALSQGDASTKAEEIPAPQGNTLLGDFHASTSGKVKVVPIESE